MPFLTPLRVEKLDNYDWILIDDLIYESCNPMFKGTYGVIHGFQTNFASIPRGLWNVFPKMGKWDAAAVIHDAAYRRSLYTEAGERVHLIKKYSDRLFYDAMRESGVSLFNARLMYTMVSLFGSGPPISLPDN